MDCVNLHLTNLFPLNEVADFKIINKMIEQLKQLEKFQKSFNSTFNYKPTLIRQSDFDLRYKLMREENEEYLEACQNNDLIEVADALGDQLFVLLGTIVSHGLQDLIIPIFNEITASNMSKLDENGNPIINGQNGVFDETKPIGKILKSDKYFKPDLKKFL